MNDLILGLALRQVALPSLLIAVHAMVPAASRAGLMLRTLAILLLLLYAALAGIWLFPPWWTPHALAALHLALSARLWLRMPGSSACGRGRKPLELGVSAVGVIAALGLLLPAHEGRTTDAAAIDLQMPLGPGRYLVVSGGAAAALNAHLLTLDKASAAAFRGQSFGVDIIGIDGFGLRAHGVSPPDPAAYVIYGRAVRAPCAGRVLSVVDGVPDNRAPVMNREVMTGNSVILGCDGLAVVLAHFAPGSIEVSEGDRVEAGRRIARVGNSGNSGEPHLHIHVQTVAPPDAPISGKPLWFTIDGRLPTRNDRLIVRDQQARRRSGARPRDPRARARGMPEGVRRRPG